MLELALIDRRRDRHIYAFIDEARMEQALREVGKFSDSDAKSAIRALKQFLDYAARRKQ